MFPANRVQSLSVHGGLKWARFAAQAACPELTGGTEGIFWNIAFPAGRMNRAWRCWILKEFEAFSGLDRREPRPIISMRYTAILRWASVGAIPAGRPEVPGKIRAGQQYFFGRPALELEMNLMRWRRRTGAASSTSLPADRLK